MLQQLFTILIYIYVKLTCDNKTQQEATSAGLWKLNLDNCGNNEGLGKYGRGTFFCFSDVPTVDSNQMMVFWHP